MTNQTGAEEGRDQVKSCGFLVFRKDPREEFLLMKHAHRWDLPKGHVDEGETEIQCALRELWEETSISADAIRIDDAFRFTLQYPVFDRRIGRKRDKTLVIFLAELIQPVEIRVSEHPDFSWLAWSPPHKIQWQTIDPLLAAVAKYRGQ
jgi:bis(5'-nucleosidyl)-tetraphosphatase